MASRITFFSVDSGIRTFLKRSTKVDLCFISKTVCPPLTLPNIGDGLRITPAKASAVPALSPFDEAQQSVCSPRPFERRDRRRSLQANPSQ
jgi:hypothetical protein